MDNNLYIANGEEIKGHKADIKDYVIKELKSLLNEDTDTDNITISLQKTLDILEAIEENEDTDIITLKYNTMGNWYEAETIEEGYILEICRLYDEYLQRTEQRGMSWGEVAEIENATKQELDNLYNELTLAEMEIAKKEK